MMSVRAVRGATTVDANTREEILQATAELLKEIIEKNDISNDDAISMVFTLTNDLNAVFPAFAARELGFTDISLMCMQEIDVPGSLAQCIRIMVHFNTEKRNSELRHVYLKGAKVLRPDINK